VVGEQQEARRLQEQELLREWGKMVAAEIEHLSSQAPQAIRQGHLQDALAEARIVLEMTGHKDLARKAHDLYEKLAEARIGPRGVRIISPAYEALKREARILAGEIRKRMEEVALGASKAPTS